MSKPKIAFFELEEWEKEYIHKQIRNYSIIFSSDHLNSQTVKKIKDCSIVAAFIYSQISKEILDQLPKLQLISTMSTGFDHIDLEECKRRNITVCNVPTYGENTVAEHTFALILDLSRKIHKSYLKTSRGDFSLEGLRGFDLKGKTIGIVGCGNIGQHVARMAKGFEMKVLVFDMNKDKKLAKKLGFRYVSFDYLLKNSDIVTLHVPYNRHTHHLINKDNITKIKKNALLINTARGGLIDTDALVEALQNRHLAGAGLDVLEGECYIKEEKQMLPKHMPLGCDLKTVLENHILMKMDNVIITPHNAFNSEEALKRILDSTLDNIKSFIKGRKINVVKA